MVEKLEKLENLAKRKFFQITKNRPSRRLYVDVHRYWMLRKANYHRSEAVDRANEMPETGNASMLSCNVFFESLDDVLIVVSILAAIE